jgi:hypothetical protein
MSSVIVAIKSSMLSAVILSVVMPCVEAPTLDHQRDFQPRLLFSAYLSAEREASTESNYPVVEHRIVRQIITVNLFAAKLLSTHCGLISGDRLRGQSDKAAFTLAFEQYIVFKACLTIVISNYHDARRGYD